MLNTHTIKRLVELTVSEGKVNNEVRRFVLSRLSRNNLRHYLIYLKKELKSRKVFVRSAGIPAPALKIKIDETFKSREIFYEIDKSLGGGLQIEHGDDLIDINMKKMIEKTLYNIRETI